MSIGSNQWWKYAWEKKLPSIYTEMKINEKLLTFPHYSCGEKSECSAKKWCEQNSPHRKIIGFGGLGHYGTHFFVLSWSQKMQKVEI